MPIPLAGIVARAMHRDRTQRYQSARELLEALEAFLAGRDTLPRSVAPPAMPAEFAQTMPSGTTPSTPVMAARTPQPMTPQPSPRADTPRSETPFASESMRPQAPRSSRGLVIGGVVALLVAGGLGTAALTGAFGGGGGRGEETSAAGPGGTVSTPPANDPPPSDPRAQPPPPVERDPEPTPPVPETRTVQFEIRPEGASVEAPGVPACRAPCSLTLPHAATTVRITARGFAPGAVTLTPPFQDRVEHRLVRARRGSQDGPTGPGPGGDPGDDIIKTR